MPDDSGKRQKLDEAISNVSDVYDNLKAIKGERYAFLVRKMVSLMIMHDSLIKKGIAEPTVKGLITDLGELIYHVAKYYQIDLATEDKKDEFIRCVKSVRMAAKQRKP